jgi:hypothetical protein
VGVKDLSWMAISLSFSRCLISLRVPHLFGRVSFLYVCMYVCVSSPLVSDVSRREGDNHPLFSPTTTIPLTAVNYAPVLLLLFRFLGVCVFVLLLLFLPLSHVQHRCSIQNSKKKRTKTRKGSVVEAERRICSSSTLPL